MRFHPLVSPTVLPLPTMTAPLFSLPATELSRLLAAREISSVELVRAHLDRIQSLDGRLRAFTTVHRERALAEAERADQIRGRGEAKGPLFGLPVTVKECFDIEGEPTTIGVLSKRSHRAKKDAAIVKLLREAGAIVLGRTNVSQFMLFVESRNPVYGQTSNAFSFDHTPGGSSGGEAAAIAAGMSPLGVGTDIGGSIRVPAHFSGIAGLKPTLDRLPMQGCATSLPGQEAVRAQLGPMARTVKDLELLFSGLDPRRASVLDPRVPPMAWEPVREDFAHKLRVGVYLQDGLVPPSAAVVRAVEHAARILEERGCEIVPFTPPNIEELIFSYTSIFGSDGGTTLGEQLGDDDIDIALKSLKLLARMPHALRMTAAKALEAAGEPIVGKLLASVGRRPVEELWKLTSRIRNYRFEMLSAFDAERLDVVLCPPFATPALPHGDSRDFVLAGSFSMLWNHVQFPAGVVPVSRVRIEEATRPEPRGRLERHAAKVDAKSAGLPVGVQVVGRPWEDARVLAVMQAIEDALIDDPERPVVPVT